MTSGLARAHENSEQHTRDVRVENSRPFAKCETHEGAGGIGADALERSQRFFVVWQPAAVMADGFARNRMKPAWPDVVAERIPRPNRVVFRRRRQGLQSR